MYIRKHSEGKKQEKIFEITGIPRNTPPIS
jgi:hypothetical protein